MGFRVIALVAIFCFMMGSNAFCSTFSDEEVKLWAAYYKIQGQIEQYESIVRKLRNDGVEAMGSIKQLRKLRLEDERNKAGDQRLGR